VLAITCGCGSAAANATLKIRAGDSFYGPVILTVDGEHVRLGDLSYGKVIFTFDGKQLLNGDSRYGIVLATAGSGGQGFRTRNA
jgi:hypothetical protein